MADSKQLECLRKIQRLFGHLGRKYHAGKTTGRRREFVSTEAYTLWLVQSGQFKVGNKADLGALVGGMFQYYAYLVDPQDPIDASKLAKSLHTTPEEISKVYNSWSKGREAWLRQNAIVAGYKKQCEAFWTLDPMSKETEQDPLGAFQLSLHQEIRKQLHLKKDSSHYALAGANPGVDGVGFDRLVLLPGFENKLHLKKHRSLQPPTGPSNVPVPNQAHAHAVPVFCTNSHFSK